jgi:gamma-glutamyltranspeptidase/glutathione hydrolase
MRDNQYPGRSNVLSSKGIAATSHPLSSLEAISILKKGGNAVDSAIAASAVQAVVEPGATGVGGDCFALIAIKGKKPVSINGSGINPKKASLDFFYKNKINKIELTSPHSVTIPGAVHAWYTMHQKFGKLDFNELFITAENYAREGYPVYEIIAQSWKENFEKLNNNESSKKTFLKNNTPYKFGEIHQNIPLADTLSSIGKTGIKDFYNGYIAEDMVKSLNALGGKHSMEDFVFQNTIISDSIYNQYKNHIIHQCPPNGPGITVLLMMAILEKFNFNNIEPLSAERFHLQAEATKVAYETRENIIGDPKFTTIEINSLLKNEFIETLTKKIKLNECYVPKNFTITAHPSTVYLTVVDRDLNAVSFINSICFPFGSGITSKKTGILLQNRGVNFRLKENHPNCIEGHKRPLHTIIPGLITDKKNRVILSYGVMGGQYQPVGQAHVLQNIFDFNMNIQESIDFPRAFNLNGKYQFEKTVPEDILKKLESIGHKVSYTNGSLGGGQAIYIDQKRGILIAGSDPRKDGCAIGI